MGASPTGDHPFLDRFNVMTRQAERLFQSDNAGYETVVGLLAPDGSRFVTRRETQTEPPNLYIRNAKSDAKTALTDFRDPSPQLRGITKRLVTYKRADGVPLSFTLYLPPTTNRANACRRLYGRTRASSGTRIRRGRCPVRPTDSPRLAATRTCSF